MAGGNRPVISKTGAVGNNRLVVNILHPNTLTGSQHKQVILMMSIFNLLQSPGKELLCIGGF